MTVEVCNGGTKWNGIIVCSVYTCTYVWWCACILPLWWSTPSSCVSNAWLIILCLLHSQHSLPKTFQISSNLFSSREHTWRTSGQRKAAPCPKWRYVYVHTLGLQTPHTYASHTCNTHTHNTHTVFDMLEQRSPPKAGLSASIYVRMYKLCTAKAATVCTCLCVNHYCMLYALNAQEWTGCSCKWWSRFTYLHASYRCFWMRSTRPHAWAFWRKSLWTGPFLGRWVSCKWVPSCVAATVHMHVCECLYV